jgi:hypothetical protein
VVLFPTLDLPAAVPAELRGDAVLSARLPCLRRSIARPGPLPRVDDGDGDVLMRRMAAAAAVTHPARLPHVVLATLLVRWRWCSHWSLPVVAYSRPSLEQV